ncbi:tetratricopeptide repeat protein [Dapis sp. BLCC M126]|uniref:tetratricopeptide repeat protein n=1 Tax=Dapis sp. BLCC M126 TaxID=3400189 RepID=UPI003CFB2837
MDRKFDDSEIKQALQKYQSGNWEEAINICHKIIKKQPNNFLALELLGICAYKNNQIEQAIAYYQKSLKLNPNYAEIHNNLAVALQQDGQIDAAFNHCQAAIKFRPNYAEAWHNLGRILREKGEFEAAIESYQKSLELKQNYAEAYNSLGSIFLELGKFSESQKYYQKALKLDKNNFNAHFGLATVLLKQGNFIQGFSEYEWRCQRQDYVTNNFAQPVWDGSDFSGKTLLVYTEQGLGDSIQFIRYIPLVKKLGGRVIVGCNKAGLKLLFTTILETDELFVIGEEFPDFDLQIPLMSLPRIFDTTLKTIPAEIPYLFVPESTKIKLPETTNSFNIGITWGTNSQIKTSKKRSCSVEDLQSILSLDNASFYILQKEVSPQDLEWLKSQTQIHNLSSYFNDLADTAAAIKQLDLVITIDTVIAHLAGALGKPVWVMLNFDSDWRWLRDSQDSPWYPTMRLFRQEKIGDWQGVCREVFDALSSKLLSFKKTDYPSIIQPGSSVTTQQLLTAALEQYQVENWKEAEKICDFIIQYQPHCATALEILALCAKKTGKIDLEIAYHQKVINLNPNNYKTHLGLAIALKKQKKLEQAIVHNQRAIELKPNDASAWHNLGLIFKIQGNIPEVIRSYQKSLEIQPNNVHIYYSWGNILKEQGNLTEAKVLYEKCLELNPNHINAHFARGFILLKQGNFLAGFSEYEWRYQREDYITRNFAEPVWDGSDFSGKTLLIYTEQGLGDSIQFIRYIPLVKKLGDRVIVECNQSGLKFLFTTVSEIDEIFVEGEKLLDFDLQVSLMSLPRIFQTTLETIPAEIPYLSVPKSIEFPIPLTPEKNLKVGICWQTNSTTETSQIRSCSVEYLQEIINIDTVNFYILQKEVSPQDLEWLNSRTKIYNLGSSFNNLADTAAAIKQLDLVITIDTVIAHLAGALGKPVWVMLNFDSDWRWLTNREDSPWYPTMRLFRQPKIEDWDSVFVEVKQALIEFIESQQSLTDLPANFDLAYQYYQQKNLVEAEKICRRILKEKPEDFQALHLLAVLENLAGRNEVAIQLLNQVITLRPNSSQAYSNLGKILKKEYRLEEAIPHYQKAISLQPSDSSNYSNLGLIFLDKGEIDSAIINYEKSREINPNNSSTNLNLGFAWEKKRDLSKASTYYQQAIKINPNYTEAWYNLGNILQKQGQLDLAVEYCQKSLELNPDYVEAYYSLGFIFLELGKLAESQKYYEQALKLDKNHVNSHFGLASVLLKQGDFIAGFSKYEWRSKTKGFITRNLSQPVWDGSNFSGKTLLVYTEQGLGDSIQFIRYIPLVKKLGGRVIFECNQPGLKFLFTTVSEIDELFVEGEKLPDFDLQVSLMSLPRIFQTTLETIPAEIPYLSVPKSIDFPIPFAPEKNLKVGICWQTKRSSIGDSSQVRSCSVEYLQAIINIDTVNFYILQKEVSPQDLEWLKSQTQIHNLGSSFNHLADTAAAIKQLDLVITIDTVIAHLAGALGKPVWVMLNFDSDWRWLTDREDSPWYPTMRLFRQSKIGDWNSIFKQVKENLENVIDNNSIINKSSETKAIQLSQESIKKALAQYQSCKHQKNIALSTSITSAKNLQTQIYTSEIMNIIGINWPLNHNTGWGIYGINITLQLLKNKEYKPLLLTPASIQPGTLNPLHQALLNPAFNAQKNLQNQFKNHQEKKIKLNLPILQALNGNFSVNNNFLGTQNIGIIFSENTKFTSEQINRAKAYNLIITGSTWNTNILEGNGIKPVQKVLQGIDQTIFHPAPKSNTFSDRFVIFSGGKLEYRKGQDIVIAAFKIFQKRHPEALLITAWHNFWPQFMGGIEQTGNVVGLPKISQDKRLQITEWLLTNDIPENAVIDVGPIPNYMVGQILRETDVSVFTNRCEGGTNLVAMESLACGIPTIISANTGHLDIINDSHCYPLRSQKSVKPTPHFPGIEGWGESDVEEVVEMLEKVYSDRENAKVKGSNAVNFMQNLTWEKQIQRLLVVLQNII